MRPLRTITALCLLLAIATVLSACGTVHRFQSRAKPHNSVLPRTRTVAVYFSDWQAQHPIPEARTVPEAPVDALATHVVEALLAGPRDPHLHQTLPGVRLLEPVTLDGTMATVNLSKELLAIQGSAGAGMAVTSLVFSLTDFHEIDRVQVLVEGQQVGGHDHMALGEPITRGLLLHQPMVDEDRIDYLQARASEGTEQWRNDASAVLRWEGRMFGFTPARLLTAVIQRSPTTTLARLLDGDATYVVRLSRRPDGSIWTVDQIEKTR